MKQSRLDSLADGVFAIVMTLLVLDMRLPEFDGITTNHGLWQALTPLFPVAMSYGLSFVLLFTYWRGHNYIATGYAKNVNNTLSTINAFFLLFVALVPFTTRLLGSYSDIQMAIALYGLNVIIIGLLLYMLREYALRSQHIKSPTITKKEQRRGTIRIFVPIFSAAIAIAISVYDTQLSLTLFTFAILFNLSSASTNIITRMFRL